MDYVTLNNGIRMPIAGFEIPVEFPTTVELVVNRKSAQAMGIALPPALLARASRIID